MIRALSTALSRDSGRVVRFIRAGFLGMGFLIALEAVLAMFFFWLLADNQRTLTRHALPALSKAQALVQQVKQLDKDARLLIASSQPYVAESHLYQARARTVELRQAVSRRDTDSVRTELGAEISVILDSWDALLNRVESMQKQRFEIRSQSMDFRHRLLAFYRQIELAARSTLHEELEAISLLIAAGATDDPAELGLLRLRFERLTGQLRATGIDIDLHRAFDDGAKIFDHQTRLLQMELQMRHLADRLVILDRLVGIVETNAANLSRKAQDQAEAGEQRLLVMMAILFSIIVVGIGIAVAVTKSINHRILLRLQRLHRTMQDYVEGSRQPIVMSGDDEIADMASSFQHFVDKVVEHESQLEGSIAELNTAVAVVESQNQELMLIDHRKDIINQSLEENVRERTRQLQAALDTQRVVSEQLMEKSLALEATLGNLQAAQSQLVQSEKMAALGILIAGVTHEINTPIGAIKSSGASIADALSQVLASLPELFKLLDPVTMSAFLDLISHANDPVPVLTTREKRGIRQEAIRELEDAGIEDAPQMASALMQLNVHLGLGRYLPLLRHPKSALIIEVANGVGTIMQGIGNINTAVARVAKIVLSLKSFSRVSQTDEMVEASLQDSLETVLTIYHYQIKQGTEVIRQYEDIPPIRCLPDELNQVWTNLIHNALQAMDSQGTPTVGLRREGNDAVVSIGDTGCGIPEEIRGKIFDVFFTTKPAGVGSGLGLDIVKKIIDKHQGRIEVQSKVGAGTTFSVYLPYIIELPQRHHENPAS